MATLEEIQEQAQMNLIQNAQTLAGTPMQLPTEQVAGFSPLQQQAAQMAQQGIGAYQPYLQAAQQGMQTAMGAGYAGTQGFTPTAANIGAYMDPYQQNVTQSALQEMQRQGDIQAQRHSAAASQAGAFGGARHGVVQAEHGRNLQDLMSRRVFEDMSRNYQQAQQGARADFASQQQRMQQAGKLGILGSQQLAGMGTMAQAGAWGDVGQIGQLGAQQQGQAQNVLIVQRQNLLRQMMQPYQQMQFMGGILGGLPQPTPMQTGEYNPFLSGLGSFIGGIGTGIGQGL